jgi:uncharacterized protein YyaL (SSP411 family)
MAQNLLSRETSPYLLQHRHNPVHWMAWGSQAFERARLEHKPVLLSVGYAACHWCHVMAHESFEDQETADLMNARFINIKVDREERPDIDRIYMQALHALGEHGGWPLTMFLTPDAKPFWGGTYFPKESRYGRPSFKHVLTEISRIWQQENDKVATNAAALLQALNAERRPPQATGDLSETDLDSAAKPLLSAIDLDHGGLKGAPKFPQAPLFSFLWTMAGRTANQSLADAVVITLRNICQGGIYDHLGGGIARYATDHLWLVPHFEKMLYDNAQLVSLMSRVWLTTRDVLFRQRIEETIAFVLRDMRVESGAFAASYDADSEGAEGRYYVWTLDELQGVLPPGDAEFFATIYGVTQAGNWDGKTILNRLSHPALLSQGEEEKLVAMRSALFRKRLTRTPPGFDDKVLADWNGLMIAALADAALVFGRQDWATAAEHAFSAVLGHLWSGGRLHHSWRNGETRHFATADGYANLIAAALALSPIFPRSSYVDWANRLIDAMVAHHWDEARSTFCLSAADASMVIVRPAYGEDDVTPNANAVMLANLTRLYHLEGDTRHLHRAEAILSRFAPEALDNPFGYTSLMRAFALFIDPIQIVVAGEARDPMTDTTFRTVLEAVGPDCIIQWISAADRLPPGHPAFHKAAAAKDLLYLCRGQVCAAPAESVEDMRERLEFLGLAGRPATTRS